MQLSFTYGDHVRGARQAMKLVNAFATRSDQAIEDALGEISVELLAGLEIGPDADELIRRCLSLCAAAGKTAYVSTVMSAARTQGGVITRPTPPL